jgi:hypothetical protein
MSHLLLLSMDFNTYIYILSKVLTCVFRERNGFLSEMGFFVFKTKLGCNLFNSKIILLKKGKKERGKYNNVCEAYV